VSIAKPETPQQFSEWSTEATCGRFSRYTPTWYATGQNNLFTQLQDSEFFAQFATLLENSTTEFRQRSRAQLLAVGTAPEVEWHKKSYESFLEKMFRKNCVENLNFPSPPLGGWVSLDSAFSAIDDIVRTTIFVAYADAPDFLAKQIEESAERFNLCVVHKDHVTEKGYYARHVYISLSVPIASLTAGGEFTDQKVAVEVQIATQLQGALREITHFMYERERLNGAQATDWKRDFRSGRFRAAYMAHSLRFIEAMILEVRDTIAHSKKSEADENP
jgi:ppGpp synthetase/RelA/SpoT-type nucleotidyltranferase